MPRFLDLRNDSRQNWAVKICQIIRFLDHLTGHENRLFWTQNGQNNVQQTAIVFPTNQDGLKNIFEPSLNGQPSFKNID